VITLFDLLAEKLVPIDGDVIIRRWGEGTAFDAILRIKRDPERGEWDGYLVFRDARFSPFDADVPGLQFRYELLAAGGCGVLSIQRAEETWKTLCTIFQSLMKGADNS
jgi:hypothetical protein